MRHTLVFVLGCVLAACLTGCATAYGPRQVDDYATYAMWSRVGELRPGSEIEVATTNTLLRDRIFVSADAADVTVLSLDDPALPSSASRALRYMARRQPEHGCCPRISARHDPRCLPGILCRRTAWTGWSETGSCLDVYHELDERWRLARTPLVQPCRGGRYISSALSHRRFGAQVG
jgi:hypothetical protein